MAMAVAFSCAHEAVAADPVPGFSEGDLATAQTASLYIVSNQQNVRPQVAYRTGRSHFVFVDTYPGTSIAQGVGINVASGVIANLLINASEREAAVQNAEQGWRWLQAGKCTVDADTPVRNALQVALREAGITTVAQSGLLEGRELDEVVTATGPRLVLQHSSSFTPDLGTVLTSVIVSSWGPEDAKGKAQESPDWVNLLMSASPPMVLQAKTDQDTALLLRAAEQAYADTGNNALIAKVNAAGHNADRIERLRAVDTLRSHNRIVREAKQQNWSEKTEPMRRAIYWTGDQCALQNQAVQDNATEVARLLQAMFAMQLPAAKEMGEAPAFTQDGAEQALAPFYRRSGQREVEAVAASFHLSKMVGVPVRSWFFENVLELDADKQ